MDVINPFILNTICWLMFGGILEKNHINANSADFELPLRVDSGPTKYPIVMQDHTHVNIVEQLTNKLNISIDIKRYVLVHLK